MTTLSLPSMPSRALPPTLQFAILFSLALHAVLLFIHFGFPDMISRASEKALDVILVNGKSATKPTQAQAKAQANLDGGGNTDEDRRSTSPLPASAQVKDGDDLMSAQRRVAELEAMQRQLLTVSKANRPVNTEKGAKDPLAPAPNVNGQDLVANSMEILRREAEINKSIEDYSKRPRKKFVGLRTEEYRLTQYLEDVLQKVERIGNLNYPEAARNGFRGDLAFTLVIRSDGTVEAVSIYRTSGSKALDEAALRILKMAGSNGFPPFPDTIRKEMDAIDLTRRFIFTGGDRLQAN